MNDHIFLQWGQAVYPASSHWPAEAFVKSQGDSEAQGRPPAVDDNAFSHPACAEDVGDAQGEDQ